MNDLDLISRQLRREIEQGEIARKRLEDNTRRAEDKKYASSTTYGQTALKAATGAVADHMASSLKNVAKGRGGPDFALCFKHLKDADAEKLAVLALKVCLDVLGQEKHPTLTELTVPISQAIEIELKLSWYLSKDPDLFKRTRDRFHGSTGTAQKHTVYRLRFNEAGLAWESWPRTTHHKIGAWAIRSIIETTGWLEKELINGKTKTSRKTCMRFSPEFLGLRDSIMQRALELAYCLWPMLCPPNEWSNEEKGGYLTEEIRGCSPMVRRAGPIPPCKQGNAPIQFLNNLQQQEYRLNSEILDVADWCYENRRSVGKLRISDPQQRLDPFIGDTEAEPERFKQWKRNQRQIDDFNAQLFQYNYRATETMFVARMYRDEPRFWIPWSFDYRGRVYPLNSSLNPQGTDFDKSLLYFVDEGPVNEYWLAWHCATTYGNDKLSHDDRVAWTRENLSLIAAVATDPIRNIKLWENLNPQGQPNGEPWCFLSAAMEYYHCVINPTKQTSGLPIGVDATCSGLQHLASMTRDAVAAKQVNVITGDEDKPSDGYLTVAKQALTHLQDMPEVHPFMSRKVTKRTVMTTPYGVSRDSARGYIREALHDAGFDLSIPGRLGPITDAIYRKAMPEVFEGPVKVMNWLQKQARDLLAKQETIEWTTPSGFRVVQDIRKSKAKKIDTMLMGSVVHCTVGDGWGGPDFDSHKGAIAPNLVHSLDASLLHLMFLEWNKPFTVIHDCILGRACDMDEMMAGIRLHHAEIYKGKPLEDWAIQQGLTEADIVDEEGEPLIKDTLNLDDVLTSPYFFC